MNLAIPLAGMQSADASFEAAATAITQAFRGDNGNPQTPAASSGDSVDLSAEVVSVLNARQDFATNVRLATIENRMAQSTLSLLG